MRRLVVAGVLGLGLWGCGPQGSERATRGGNPDQDTRGSEQAALRGGAMGQGGTSEVQQPGTGGSGAGGQAPAGDGTQGCSPEARGQQAALTVTGTVRSATRQTLTVEQPGGKVFELLTDARTCVLQGGQAMAPEALREGVEVRAGYEANAQGQRVARVVEAGAGNKR